LSVRLRSEFPKEPLAARCRAKWQRNTTAGVSARSAARKCDRHRLPSYGRSDRRKGCKRDDGSGVVEKDAHRYIGSALLASNLECQSAIEKGNQRARDAICKRVLESVESLSQPPELLEYCWPLAGVGGFKLLQSPLNVPIDGRDLVLNALAFRHDTHGSPPVCYSRRLRRRCAATHRQLLPRPRRQRPRHRTAPEQRDELAASHVRHGVPPPAQE
jgi:hypothetical protein